MRGDFDAHDQGHVFRFWDRLTASERSDLLAQCASIDLPALERSLAAARGLAGAPGKLEPLAVECLPERGGDARRFAAARARGEALLRAGSVGVVVVAGGQATRLGYPGPKGCFPLGPVSERSLFELQAQKLRRLAARLGRALPWCVMTSPATDAATRAFFERHGHFGLAPEDVRFFVQGMVPSVDFGGRLVLAAPGRLMQNPDGHGGSLTALARSGCLDDLERRGVTTLFYYQVDNPLIRMADPTLLGFHGESGAEMSCKVVRKRDPDEKVGVLARRDGRVVVVEYTELEEEYRCARDSEGGLAFWAGNLAIHALDTAFVRRVAEQPDRWLPFHASAKKLPVLGADGRAAAPEEPNGLKLERFIFDALPAAERVCAVEAERAEEFSPVKNAQGADSPGSARRDLVARYRAWLAAAGHEVPPGVALEIDHSQIDAPEDVRALALRDLADAGDIVRIGPGADR